MTAATFCQNLHVGAGMRIPAAALVPGDYLLHPRRFVVSINPDGEERLVVTTRAGQRGTLYTHRWLDSTPVVIAPRPIIPPDNA